MNQSISGRINNIGEGYRENMRTGREKEMEGHSKEKQERKRSMEWGTKRRSNHYESFTLGIFNNL